MYVEFTVEKFVSHFFTLHKPQEPILHDTHTLFHILTSRTRTETDRPVSATGVLPHPYEDLDSSKLPSIMSLPPLRILRTVVSGSEIHIDVEEEEGGGDSADVQLEWEFDDRPSAVDEGRSTTVDDAEGGHSFYAGRRTLVFPMREVAQVKR